MAYPKLINPKGSNLKYDGYQRGLASVVYKFFNKNSAGSDIKSMLNQLLANELHKPVIGKFKKVEFFLHLKKIFGVICN